MIIDKVKLIIAFAICALLGFLCYTIAPEADSRKWISLIITTISLFTCFAPAIAVRFEATGNGYVSGKVASWIGWIFFVILLIINFSFGHTFYSITTYTIVTSIVALVNIALIYSISKS